MTSAAPRTSKVRNTVATTTSATTTTATPSIRPMRATSFCSGVGSSTVASSISAIVPISLAMPVAVTTARPVPCTTAVPLKTMLRRSPSAAGPGRAAVSFSTASLSPVSEASCTRNEAASMSRASAPTASPSPSTRRSPRTSCALGTRCTRPSRSTADVTAVMRASAATALRALASCAYPSRPFSTTMAPITTASTGQPRWPSMNHAASEMAMAPISR